MIMYSLIVSDPFATKGIEYILALSFLAGLTIFWRVLKPAQPSAQPVSHRSPAQRGWHLPADRQYHKGHAWVMEVAPGVVRVGLNDFAQQLLGPVDRIALPRVRSRVHQGQKIWQAHVNGHAFRLPSPVEGCVLRLNPALQANSRLVNEDPYGSGWLMDLDSSDLSSGHGTLHGAAKVRQWLREFQVGLGQSLSPQLGAVLQDGGTLSPGFARALPEKRWEELVQQQLLADPIRLSAEDLDHDRQT
jgi:glycine cleavage system H protein